MLVGVGKIVGGQKLTKVQNHAIAGCIRDGAALKGDFHEAVFFILFSFVFFWLIFYVRRVI